MICCVVQPSTPAWTRDQGEQRVRMNSFENLILQWIDFFSDTFYPLRTEGVLVVWGMGTHAVLARWGRGTHFWRALEWPGSRGRRDTRSTAYR